MAQWAAGSLPAVRLALCLLACPDPSPESSAALPCCYCHVCLTLTLRAHSPRSGVGSSHCLSLSSWQFSVLAPLVCSEHGPGTPSFMGSFQSWDLTRKGWDQGISYCLGAGQWQEDLINAFPQRGKKYFSVFPLCLQAVIRCHQSASLSCVQMKDYSDKMERGDARGRRTLWRGPRLA